MNITVQGLNFKVSGHTEEFATTKLSRLERYLPRIRDIRLELSFQDNKRGQDYTIAQLTVRHERGAILRTEERTPGMNQAAIEAAINLAIDKMYRRIERFRGKRRDHGRHRGRFRATEEELTAAEEIETVVNGTTPDEDLYADWIDREPDIVKRKTVEVEPMSEDEAIEQMELLGHAFFMFLNVQTNTINVLYRRADGDYGLLMPQM